MRSRLYRKEQVEFQETYCVSYNMRSVQLESLDSGPFNSSFDVGMHNGSVVGAFEWDTYGYFVGCNKLGAQYHCDSCMVHAFLRVCKSC